MVESALKGYAPILSLDSKIHVLNVEACLKQKFPNINYTVVTDPNEIEKVIGKAPQPDQALVKVIVPEGMGMVIFKAWAEV